MNRASGARGVRDLESSVDRCEPLVAALAVAIAIAIDPVRSAKMSERGAEEAPPSDEPPPTTPSSPPALVDTPPQPPLPLEAPAPQRLEPSASSTIFATGSVIAAVGLMPAPSLGGAIGLGLRRRSLSVELSGRAETLPSDARSSAGDRLDASAYSGTLATCGHLDRFAACGVGRVGAFQARAGDVVRTAPHTMLFGALGLRLAYTQPVHPNVALRILGSVEAPLVRTSLIIDDASVWTAPPMMAALEAGALFSIP